MPCSTSSHLEAHASPHLDNSLKTIFSLLKIVADPSFSYPSFLPTTTIKFAHYLKGIFFFFFFALLFFPFIMELEISMKNVVI